jgi:protein-S-isoprenylcysteine O-methyltransferase Ste14
MRKRLMRWALACTILTVSLMLLAGDLTDQWLWAYSLVWWSTSLYGVTSMDDELARERFSPPEPGADAMALKAVRILALAHVLVAPLDRRWHLGPAVPSLVRGLALAGMGVSFVIVFRSMRENDFFSSVVRVQAERGHHVITTGPYAIVRHPGYAGMILGVPLSGLALGSWISAAVALVYSGMILRRVMFEDGFLQRSLDGYDAYVMQVRYRLLPGLW